MPRFVLLFHECPLEYQRPAHWDFMLETDGLLRTWALYELPRLWNAAHGKTAFLRSTCPPLAVGNVVDAERLPDHRLAYLDFEGPLNGNRGEVVRIDSGTFRVVNETSRLPGRFQIELSGNLLHDIVRLAQCEPDGKRWALRIPETASAPPE